jgi:Tfp pilus assembly protein PilN
MRLLPRALGFEVNRTAWRAVYVTAGPFRVTVRGCAQGRFETDDPDTMAAALTEAASALGARPGDRLGIALSRPVAHLRRIGLPKARRGAILRNLEEQAASIFPLGRAPAVVDVRSLNGRWRRGDSEGVVGAAPKVLMEALVAAAEAAGLELHSTDLGAGALQAALGGEVRTVIVPSDSGIEWVELGGRAGVRSARFFPYSSNGVRSGPNGAGDSTGASGVPAALAQSLQRTVEMDGALVLGSKPYGFSEPSFRKAPDEASSPRLRGIRALERPELTAACGAALQALGAPACFDLRTATLRRSDLRRTRRRRLVLLGAVVTALALVEVASVARLRGRVERLEGAVEELRPHAEQVIELRSAIEDALSRADVLAGLAAEQPRWSGVLAELARALPADTYLSSLRTEGRVLQLEGYAASASDVLQALRRSAMFASARLDGAVTREVTPLGERERFSLELSLRPREEGP